MPRSIDKLPAYLRKYCVEQRGDRYTPRDHAAWRYIMRQSRAFFKDHAVPIYLDGLEQTGITRDRIPLIADMDRKLQDLGWGCVPVCGFIPPAAFLDFQARRVLPVAFDMRTIEHIHYTPAPDIVHEAAGHAPILADHAYSEYLTLYAAMAQKAIFSQEDLDVYEAIRALSDIKENPDSTQAMIDAAEAELERRTAAVPFVSEAAKVARMNWWTVEYGLLGALDKPKIYGAGLLSSVGESQNCLAPKVKKLRLTVDCVETSYNITEPQPQLFVAEDLGHLTDVLKEFEQSLAYVRGGLYGLNEAKRGRTVTTTVLDSGLEISGRLDGYEADADDVEFLRFTGPVQLAAQGRELPGQGVRQHATGFSSPLGRAKTAHDRPLSTFSEADLNNLGLALGTRARLELTTGFVVEGNVVEHERAGGKLVVIKWQDCTVTRQGKRYFEPAWGDFDMGVGERVVSVFGGPADRESYGSHDVGKATTTPARQSPFTDDEIRAFDAYTALRKRRDAVMKGRPKAADEMAAARRIAKEFPNEWLLRLEAIEVASAAGASHAELIGLEQDLTAAVQDRDENIRWLVRQGVALAEDPD